ncbi:EF-hand domain-containing protein [Thioclava sp. FR2]|uniref:EF-hand domain-containing protein n=1 Tax=Thioclava sp. FR2 TaxID=3445780 RepID=UPI003EBC3FA2
MTRTMKLTALTMATLASALVATTAFADRGNGMGMGGPGMERGMGIPFAEFNFAEVDADQDGKITEAELSAWHAARTKALDADGDGFISADELAAMQMQGMEARVKERSAQMVTRLDADGDGKLSATELASRPVPTGLVDRLDTDNDGAISQAEIDAAKAKMAEGPKGFKKKRFGHGEGHEGGFGRGNN